MGLMKEIQIICSACGDDGENCLRCRKVVRGVRVNGEKIEALGNTERNTRGAFTKQPEPDLFDLQTR